MKLTMKLLALFFGMLMLANVASAESPREQLNQMVEQLQKEWHQSPDDNALREQIIKLAQTIKPALAMPDEAERRMARGTEAFKEAKSTADYQAAVKEFQQAALAAPWSGDAYFNLGLAQDKAEDYEGSLRSLKLAQLASPDSKDIKDLYYKVEYQRDKFAEQNSAAAKEAARRAAVYQGLDGGVWQLEKGYMSEHGRPEFTGYDLSNLDTEQRQHDVRMFIEIHGHELISFGFRDGNRSNTFKATFESRNFKATSQDQTDYYVQISEDGQTIMYKYTWEDIKLVARQYFKRIQ